MGEGRPRCSNIILVVSMYCLGDGLVCQIIGGGGRDIDS